VSREGLSPRRHGDTENDAPKGLTADTNEALMLRLLCSDEHTGAGRLYSSFVAALKDARTATNRDVETGECDNSSAHGSWLGALGYLALLDQIGKSYAPTSESEAIHAGPFKTALLRFAPYTSFGDEIGELQVETLYGVRCSLAHDFSLLHRDRRNKFHFHFAFGQGEGAIVTRAERAWDGESELLPENRTVVNLQRVGDLVEEIVAVMRRMARERALRCVLPGGIEELRRRYSLVATRSPSVSPCLRGEKDC